MLSLVWKQLRRQCEGPIAGNKPERIPSFASHPPGVEFTGFVEDLGQLYQRVGIVCCSILSGGGTRLKILEAAAYGKAIVSTTVGAEGLELRDSIEIVIRAGVPAFARARASTSWEIRLGAKRSVWPRGRCA
jgi:glycosyltransferase involved in cell wall biosynthesis